MTPLELFQSLRFGRDYPAIRQAYRALSHEERHDLAVDDADRFFRDGKGDLVCVNLVNTWFYRDEAASRGPGPKDGHGPVQGPDRHGHYWAIGHSGRDGGLIFTSPKMGKLKPGDTLMVAKSPATIVAPVKSTSAVS